MSTLHDDKMRQWKEDRREEWYENKRIKADNEFRKNNPVLWKIKERVSKLLAIIFIVFIGYSVLFANKDKQISQNNDIEESENSTFYNTQDNKDNSYDILNENKTVKEDNENNTVNYKWMSYDLNVKTYRNGDQIQYAQTKEEWDYANDNKIGAWCYYEDNKEVVLYNKYAVNDERGLAPEGWHIPNEEEWNKIIKSKNISFLTNSIGGMRKSNGNFKKINKKAYFWIRSNNYSNNNIALDLSDHDITHEGDIITNTGEGFSARCIKD